MRSFESIVHHQICLHRAESFQVKPNFSRVKTVRFSLMLSGEARELNQDQTPSLPTKQQPAEEKLDFFTLLKATMTPSVLKRQQQGIEGALWRRPVK